ncbi:hypothetical protein [Rubripirellula reticaptiva]|uniref:hypothetical protein n=1 Tax=Rubripirellula reticaptiva TaxID=2528013 RepID=UPI0011B5AA3E|nr:hypothetical protein [Rubripirellula reticaptiva]
MGKSKIATFAFAFAFFVESSVAANDVDETKKREVVTVEVFVKEMQLLARRNPPGKSELERQDTLSNLRQAIHDAFDEVDLEFEVKIIGVDWKTGMGTFRTSSRVPSYKPSRKMPFKITSTQPLSIPMTREQAAQINTRKPLKVRGTLRFLDKQWGSVGRPPKSQLMFTIRSEDYKQVQSIGTFITEDYVVSVGDDELYAAQTHGAE